MYLFLVCYSSALSSIATLKRIRVLMCESASSALLLEGDHMKRDSVCFTDTPSHSNKLNVCCKFICGKACAHPPLQKNIQSLFLSFLFVIHSHNATNILIPYFYWNICIPPPCKSDKWILTKHRLVMSFCHFSEPGSQKCFSQQTFWGHIACS